MVESISNPVLNQRERESPIRANEDNQKHQAVTFHHIHQLMFHHIWLNLDKMFQKLSDEDVDELNAKFIQMVCDKLHKK